MLASLKNYGFPLNHKKMREDTEEYVRKLNTKTPTIDTPIKNLSGGNQQKVLVGRWLLTDPDILIVDEPTRGIDDLGAWFADPKHHLKMLSYNALIFFNMKQTQEEKDAVMAKLDQIIADCNKLGCKMIVVVPSMDLTVPATVDEIREDAVAVLKEMVKKVEPHGIKLSIEFCGAPTMSINRFEYAYDIVTEVNHPLVGITLDQYHFHAMASEWAALEKADGKKIFVWHLNGMENMPCGAAYNNDEKRLWPGEPGDCLDHKRYADTLKKIGFEGDVCTMEVFRPDYYKLSNEENIKKAAEVTKAHVAKYWAD